MPTVLIVPGLGDSGPAHWQSWLMQLLPNAQRVTQNDWETASLPDWADRLGEAIDAAGAPAWIVAHSFGALATVVAGILRPDRIKGALLVAPPDPDRLGIPDVLLEEKLNFPSIVVGSENDPWATAASARRAAEIWGSTFVSAGRSGHINTESGHGPWPSVFGHLHALGVHHY